MAAGGIQRLVLSKLLNHAEAGITQVYDRHSYDPEKRAALDWWDAEVTRHSRQQTGDGAAVHARGLAFGLIGGGGCYP